MTGTSVVNAIISAGVDCIAAYIACLKGLQGGGKSGSSIAFRRVRRAL